MDKADQLENEPQKAISIRRNTVANYVGTISQALLGFLFVPLYIKYLGVESYGLVGFSVSLSALLRLADLGLSSTLNREFARSSALPESSQQMRGLLKTLQWVYWGIFLGVGVVIVAISPLIARHWINPGSLHVSTVQNALMLMGLTAVLQGPMSLYTGGIFGLQRHVLANTFNVLFALLRFGGVVLVLVLISSTVTAFFLYQSCVACAGTIGAGIVLWGVLPKTDTSSRFQMSLLRSVWRFAVGMSANAIFGLILFQMDKIILIKILPLKIFGYYVIASVGATAVTYIGSPLFTTFLPRYSQLYAAEDKKRLVETYRGSCQLNTIITIPAVVLLSFFSTEAHAVWTRSPDVARHADLICSLLVIGFGLNQLACLPFALQVAAGWVKLAAYTNAAAVIVLVPALIIATRLYGGVGAASVWIALNCIYVFVFVNLLHRRILRGEARRWYSGALLPLILSFSFGLSGRYLLPVTSTTCLLVKVSIIWLIVVAITVLATSDLRARIPLLLKGH